MSQGINYSHLEIAIEVAWQIGDSLKNSPRAQSRWLVADTAQKIIESGIITSDSEDIDEIVSAWIEANGGAK